MEARKKQSEAARLRPVRSGYKQRPEVVENIRGRRAIHKDGVCKKIRPEELESYLNDGWLLGMK